MKCVYCDEVKANSEVFSEVANYQQVSYAVCQDCLIGFLSTAEKAALEM